MSRTKYADDRRFSALLCLVMLTVFLGGAFGALYALLVFPACVALHAAAFIWGSGQTAGLLTQTEAYGKDDQRGE